MLKEEMDAAAERHPDVPYEPVLIDATLAGLVGGAATDPLVIPCLNRDGDLLSDLVLPLFGSIAGAESVLLAFGEDLEASVAMAEAPHGTAPALQGKDLANPMAMILAGAALLHYAGAEPQSRAVYEGVLETVAGGTRTPDLGGHAGTTAFTDAVIAQVCRKLDARSSLGAGLASPSGG
jgi:isocitrate/isopropylmalate dehydrogenase